MTSELILVIAATVCVIGVLVFVTLALRYRQHEEVAFFLVVAGILCGGGATACVSEALKRADAKQEEIQKKSREHQP